MPKMMENLDRDLGRWERAAVAWGLERGTIIIWCTANDVYSRWSGMGTLDPDTLDRATGHLKRIIEKAAPRATSLVILGPLARPAGELEGNAWEKTAAFHLERRTLKMTREVAEKLGITINYVTLGRGLTKKREGRHAITSACYDWYRRDGVHLHSEGYAKLADALHLPVWLRISGQDK